METDQFRPLVEFNRFDIIILKEKYRRNKGRKKTMADIRDILEKIKGFFSVDNLSKRQNKVILLIIALAVVPLILYFSVSAAHASILVSAQNPNWTLNSITNEEELFKISLYDPMARDIDSGNYRILSYNISFMKFPGFDYLLDDNMYWVKIENVSMYIYFKAGGEEWTSSVFSPQNAENENLTFGESVIGQFSFTGLFEDNEGIGSASWDSVWIRVVANCSHYYDSDDTYVLKYVDIQGTVVDVNQLFELNYPAGQAKALQILIYYWVITGLALGFYLFYLNKRKYSFILPY